MACTLSGKVLHRPGLNTASLGLITQPFIAQTPFTRARDARQT
jgi:hypothetical protein